MTLNMLSRPPSQRDILLRAALSPLRKRTPPPPPPADLSFGINGVQSDPQKLAAYRKVCGFSERGAALPATWVHVLAFPLHAALLTAPSFPFPMIGLVHIANTVTQHAALSAEDAVDIRATLGQLTAHDKGVRFSIHTEVTRADRVVWTEESVFLRRGRYPGLALPPAAPAADDSPVSTPEHILTWNLPEDLGRRYGLASGDLNPIHLHALSARAFGFKRAIAHGMWTQARVLATLAENPDQQALRLTTHFKLPALLPGSVSLRSQHQGQAVQFEVRDAAGEKPHARGRFEPLA